ncbi:MAG: biotin--[acetyl-CoA-carboxylase] ligase [Desulfosalsimonadaceae bacterium]
MGPQRLADLHPLWKKDLEKFGPWKRLARQAAEDTGLCGKLWQAGSKTGDCRVIICGACTSAMDVAWRLCEKGVLQPWDCVLAVSQEAGRGQHSRNWFSPAGNIYAAWRWPDADALANPEWQGLLPLLAGELLAGYLPSEDGRCIRIKWPNDILVDGRKIGGILLEQHRGKCVAGIGLNLAVHPADYMLREDFSLPATSFCHEGIQTAPLSLWTDFAAFGRQKFYRILNCFTPAQWAEVFQNRLAWLGERVLVQTGSGKPYHATIRGLAADGALMLQCGGETRSIYSGSIVPVSALAAKP